jgi:DNA-binding transcriptional LysR family regulator
MTGELVVAAAVVARLPDPDVQLAAWGVVFAIITVIQAPSNAFLPVSTALSSDRWSFRRLGRYVAVVLAALTSLHVLLAATPLYDLVLGTWMRLPEQVLEAARWPLIAMILWSPGTGTRRYLHGALIRVGHSAVTIWGAALRLGVGIAVLAIGAATLELPGALLAACGIIAGVVSETLFVVWRASVLLPRRLPEGGSATDAGGRRLGARRSPTSTRRWSSPRS